MNLDGVQIVDLTWLLPGAYGTQLLTNMGARVIKIEPPGSGDYMRDIEYPLTRTIGRETSSSEDTAEFNAVNRGKESVTLDLKTTSGRQAFYRLIEESDGVVEAFRPGVTERLRIDYETLTEYNPDIVYCSLTGYGQTGEYSDRPGHDHNYLAFSGFLDLNRRDASQKPIFPGYPLCDMAGGLFTAFSMVSAVLSRELGNMGGNYIDVAMTDVMLSFSQLMVPMAQKTGVRPGDTMLTGKFPFLDVYRTADDEFVVLAAVEPKFWTEFCRAIGREDLVDEHLTDDPAIREEVRSELRMEFGSKTRAEWEELFDDSDIPVSPVLTLSEALDHPQTASRGLLDDEFTIGFPALVRNGSVSTERPAPSRGEDTEAVLKELGLAGDTIEQITGDQRG